MDQSGQHSVVIVEDEGLIAEDIRRQLIAAGYAVPGIADAAPEAIRVIRETAPDVVLMDIRIKGEEDGIQVARRVRNDFDVPVVFLTAYEDTRTLERASQTYPYGFIRKPISGASLRGSIEMAIAKHRHDRVVQDQRDWAMGSFAAVPYAVIVADIGGCVLWLNSLAGEMTGYNRQNAVNLHYSEVLRLYDRESGDPVKDIVSAAVLNGETVALPADIVLGGRNGRSIPVEGHVAPARRGERIDGVVIAFEDASLARFREEQNRLGAKHSALRRFAEGVLERLPDLQIVEAAWDTMLLLDTLQPSERLRENVDKMHHALMDSFGLSCHLSALLRSPDSHPRRVVLNELLPRLEAGLQSIEPEFRMLLGPEPVSVQADAEELTNALSTFARYAHRRVRKGGRLVVDISHPDISHLRHWVRIRLTYPSAEERGAVDRVFEPCLQDAAQDLHTAYETIRNMGGLLAAHSGGTDAISLEVYLQQVGAAAAGQESPVISARQEAEADAQVARRRGRFSDGELK